MTTPDRAALRRAAESHVDDVLALGVLDAHDLATESDDDALDGWSRPTILSVAGYPDHADDGTYAVARRALAGAIRAAALRWQIRDLRLDFSRD